MRRVEAGAVSDQVWRTPALDRFVRWTEWPLLALAVMMIPILIIPAVSHTPGGERSLLDDLDWAIWAVFVVEYIVRLVLAADRRAFVRHNLFDLALVAIPMLRPLRVARVARALRVTRLGMLLGSGTQRSKGSLRNAAVLYALVVSGALTLLCSVLILDAERGDPKANIRSYGDAIWWALTTVSTVGYGDHYPVTALGKVVAMVLIVAGVSLFGVVTAAVASYFVEHVAKDATASEGESVEARLGRLEEAAARIEAALVRGPVR